MRNWGKYFELTDINRVTQADQQFWDKLDRGGFVRLSGRMAIDRDKYAGLKPWEKCEARAAAVGISASSGVVAGFSAARLHGIDVLGLNTTVELLLPGNKRPSGRSQWAAGTTFYGSVLPAHHIYTEHGIRVTTLVRTAADITRYHGELHGVVCFDSIFRRYPELTKQRTEKLLSGFRKFHGLAKVKKALQLAVVDAGSVPESHARYLLQTQAQGITAVEAQAEIVDEQTQRVYWVDLLVNGWLVIEIDGRAKYDGITYGPVEQTILAEREREKVIQNQGYVVLRVTPWELHRGEGDAIPFLGLVSRALGNRV